ncbi:MAG: hypothetical protein JJU00_15790 [Opitutales bacterium]|nr:hypothetical protein [Opitutales bacterium]
MSHPAAREHTRRLCRRALAGAAVLACAVATLSAKDPISAILLETAHPVHLWERSRLAGEVGKAQIFGPGIESPDPMRWEVRGGSGGFYGFVRAPATEEGELLVDLVDWGWPEEKPAAESSFLAPTGEGFGTRDPSGTLQRTHPKLFKLVIPEDVFDQPEDLIFELLTPRPYDSAVHVLAEEMDDLRMLARRQGVTISRRDGVMILHIPALDPWGVLRIRTAAHVRRLEATPRQDSLGLRGEKRWAVLGDSITQSGRYHRYLENFLRTRFPESDLLIFNHGIGGDSTDKGLIRLDWDVFPSRPTVVSVKYGMNDVGRALYFTRDPAKSTLKAREERLEAYRENLRSLTDSIRERGARVILVTPSPADDTMQSDPMVHYEVNEGLARAAAFVRSLAAAMDLPVVRIFEPMQALNLALQEEDATATLVGRDRVHPGVEGHFLMAYLWLRKMFGEVPVSTLVIDAEKERAVVEVGGKVETLEASSNTVSIVWQAESLPFPVPDRAAALAVRLGFNELFNREILAVRGLSPGKYQLSIDRKPVHVASAVEWSAGVNLASLDTATPQLKQAQEVVEILERKQDIQQALSDIAFCELRLWGDRPRPVNMEEMKVLLHEAGQRERQDGSLRAAILRRYREYEYLKRNEEELRQTAIHFALEARKRALPNTREFVLKEVSPKNKFGTPELESNRAEVWLCAGQSNMAFRVSRAEDQDAILARLEGATVYAGDSSGWTLVTNESAPRLSAVGISFAASLSRKLDRPVAISVAAAGGTSIDAWLPLGGFPSTDEAKRLAKLVDDPEVWAAAAMDAEDFRPAGEHRLAQWGLGRAVPTSLFEKHIRPLQGVPFDGVLWYQGESNTRSVAQAGEYEAWLRALIKSYRDFFSNPDLPFVIVQLPRFERANPEANEAWSLLRKIQQEVAESMENVGWVDIYDLGDPDDIHPVGKQEVGERAAAVAAKLNET